MPGMFILVPRHRSAAMSSFIQSYLLLTRPRTHPEEQQLIDSYRSKFMTWGGAGFAGGALVGWSLISLTRRKVPKIPGFFSPLMAVVLGSGGTLVAPLMLIPKMQEDALRLPPHCPLRKELIRQLIERYPDRASDVVAIVNAGDAARRAQEGSSPSS